MKAHYSRRAIAQIAEILATIAADNPRAAVAVGRRIETLASLLARHPSVGRLTSLADVRVVPTKPYPYLIFYRSSDATGITILRVRHMARKEEWSMGR